MLEKYLTYKKKKYRSFNLQGFRRIVHDHTSVEKNNNFKYNVFLCYTNC